MLEKLKRDAQEVFHQFCDGGMEEYGAAYLAAEEAMGTVDLSFDSAVRIYQAHRLMIDGAAERFGLANLMLDSTNHLMSPGEAFSTSLQIVLMEILVESMDQVVRSVRLRISETSISVIRFNP
jgi:hypothetical protein